MRTFEHIQEAMFRATNPFDRSALRCMLQGTIPYEKEFCDKFYKMPAEDQWDIYEELSCMDLEDQLEELLK